MACLGDWTGMTEVVWSMSAAAMLQVTRWRGLSRCPHVQISSPSGKALFQWVANETAQVDFYICALSFGKNDLGERQRIGATVSIYLNGTFVWCAFSFQQPCRLASAAAAGRRVPRGLLLQACFQ